MKKPFVITLIVLVTASLVALQRDFSKLTGPYLGRKPPGMIPSLFMTSAHRIHSAPAFSPDLKEVYWSIFPKTNEFSTRTQVILVSRNVDNQWSAPRVAGFSGKYFDGGPVFDRKGRRLYFYSRRPLEGNAKRQTAGEIWYVERRGNSWSPPRHLNLDLKGDKLFFSIAENNNLYFTSGHGPGGMGSGRVDIYMSRWLNDFYKKPIALPEPICSREYLESDALISPDEEYLIFYSFEKPGNLGQYDLYASFKIETGWSIPVNLGKTINQGVSRFPGFSPDGKYLFFTRRDGIYWVDAKVVERLRN